MTNSNTKCHHSILWQKTGRKSASPGSASILYLQAKTKYSKNIITESFNTSIVTLGIFLEVYSDGICLAV